MLPKSEHLMNEPDIGSGEKKPADSETEEMIEQIPPRELNSSVPPEKPERGQADTGNSG